MFVGEGDLDGGAGLGDEGVFPGVVVALGEDADVVDGEAEGAVASGEFDLESVMLLEGCVADGEAESVGEVMDDVGDDAGLGASVSDGVDVGDGALLA